MPRGGAAHADEQACLDTLVQEDRAAARGGGLDAQVNGTYAVPQDTAALDACLAELETTACDVARVFPSCVQALTRRAQAQVVSAGSPCTRGVVGPGMCAAGLYCAGTSPQEQEPSCGTCRALKAAGAACAEGAECVSGTCSNMLCAEVPAAATVAAPGAACGTPGALLCPMGPFGVMPCPAGEPRTCAARPSLGEPCNTAAAESACVQPLRCVAATCQARLADGMACTADEDCVGTCAGEGAARTCAPLPAPGAPGEACTAAGCAPLTIARRDAPPGDCACEATVARGETCHVVAGATGPSEPNCAVGDVCVRPFLEETGTCQAPRALGSPCELGTDCASQACSAVPGRGTPVCVAPMCAAPATCTGVNNLSTMTALPLTLGDGVDVSLCPSRGAFQYWRLPGQVSAGQAFFAELYAAWGNVGDTGLRPGAARLAWFTNGAPQSGERVVTSEPDDGAAWVVLSSALSRDTRMTLMVRAVEPETCSVVLTNRLDQAPAPAVLGATTQGHFCPGRTAQDAWHWRVAGPFTVDDLLLTDVTYEHSVVEFGDALRVDLGAPGASGMGRYRGRRHVTVTQLTQATPHVDIVASGNPGIRSEESFTFRVSRDTGNAFGCEDPPQNITGASAAALVPGQSTTVRGCNAERYRALFMRTGALPAGTILRITSTRPAGAPFLSADVLVRPMGAETVLTNCVLGSTCTVPALTAAADAVFLRVPVAGATAWEGDLTFTLTLDP